MMSRGHEVDDGRNGTSFTIIMYTIETEFVTGQDEYVVSPH